MHLLDISADALRAVLQHLEPKDLCSCKRVCRKLGALAREVLHSLGGWPEGLWHRTDLSGQPGGALVWIQLRGSALHVLQLNHAAERTGAFCQILLNTTRAQVVIGAVGADHLVLPATTVRINSSAGTMIVKMPHEAFDTERNPPVEWHGQGTCQRAALSELLSRWTMSQLLAFFGAWINEDEPLPNGPPPLRLHRIMPLPHALSYPTAPAASQLQPGFTAAQALQCLMGLWTACYGGHGPEILHVWFDTLTFTHEAPMVDSSIPWSKARPRLVGCKVTGDPNVPANQWSFIAQAGEMKLGRWDGRGYWSEEPEETYRPIVKFHGLPMLVDMRERQVLARFRCHGCINKTPGNFQPEWVTAQLLLYEGPKPMFSVLFDDIEERFRHIMDFEPVPLPCKPALSWLEDSSITETSHA